MRDVDRTEWPQDIRDIRICFLCDTYHVHRPPHHYDIRVSGMVSAYCDKCGEETCQGTLYNDDIDSLFSDELLEEVLHYSG